MKEFSGIISLVVKGFNPFLSSVTTYDHMTESHGVNKLLIEAHKCCKCKTATFSLL
jgi:hypothetical protein